MPTYFTQGEAAIRAENVDKAIKRFIEPMFVMKQVCMTAPSSSNSETYYRESDEMLTASTDIPRGAAFPTQSVKMEKLTAYMKKFGLEEEVSHEDVTSNNIDVIKQATFKLAEAIAYAVDTTIINAINTNAGMTEATPADWEWDSTTIANRRPQDQIGNAIRKMSEHHRRADTLVMNPKDAMNFTMNDVILGSFSPTSGVITNGKLGNMVIGLKVLQSTACPADTAFVLQSKRCATYRVNEPLKTVVKYEEGIKHVIRAWERGTCFVTDPSSIVKITNTAL